ncbi:conserved hypothetical protein [Methanocella paludicola SANAE]|uniref:EamA domain-containing protein n=1 Tax=Methanocella paludicola (strain DSM 17711 / JCM 13418 / NBRC 101707 / SANAE) TaxID=304371 RepID=D1YV40_METPS|nr:EamA family transporter [Methanocella paludicola]BAI60312.1 conserved hypothetical protein [Methanocella paludicola SANAE]
MNKVIIDILIGIVFASFGQLFFKVGANNVGEISFSNLLQLFNVYIIVGLILYAIGSVFWIIALSKADLSYVYPFIALTFIVVYAFSILVLKEPFHAGRMIGTAIIIIGLCVLVAFD